MIDDAQKRGEIRASAAGEPDASDRIVTELLSLTVCDPACGSGHFLVAAARRIAKRVAAVREGNPEPTLDAVRHALHEVIAQCVYGVDLNPMAVELAKVSLWLEALEPGKPLGFLDAHIKHGNALIGATPALMDNGIPNKAFKAVEGDDPKFAAFLEKQNDRERSGQSTLFPLGTETRATNTALASGLRAIIDAPSGTLAQVHDQEAAYEVWKSAPEYVQAQHLADAWCAAFMWHKTKDAPLAITHDVFLALRSGQAAALPQSIHDEIVRLRDEYRFFHWHLAFPDIFAVPEHPGSNVEPATGCGGGFSCVLGNPPWDKVDFKDQEYFSVVEPSISKLSGATRREKIRQWAEERPEAGERYYAARSRVKTSFLFFGQSGAYPLCGKGLSTKGVNSLQVDHLFMERFAAIAAPEGRFGAILPTAIATGAGAQFLFQDLARRGAIRHLYDFENSKPLFSGVDSRYNFCLLSITGRKLREPTARYAFFLSEPAELDDGTRVFTLTPHEISLVNPNTGTLPVFRNRRDADLTLSIYHRIPVLWDEFASKGNPWGLNSKRLFDMTDDSDLFRTHEQLEADSWKLHGNVFLRGEQRMIPLYEAKMAHHFDHRWNQYRGTGNTDYEAVHLSEKQNPECVPLPRYWVADSGLIPTHRNNKDVEVPGVTIRLRELRWEHDWLLGWRRIGRATDERTAIPAFIPRAAVGNTYPLVLPSTSAALAAALTAAQSSLVFDFVARQNGGADMPLMIWKQLPVPAPETLAPHTAFLTSRVLELVYTSYDMSGLAHDLGDHGGPFQWDEGRRAQLRAELDAYFFHLYGMNRPDVEYILETFQTDTGGLKNNEIVKYGTYRTRDFVLAEYDRMAPCGLDLDTPLIEGENYMSTLNPPPGHGPRHPARDGTDSKGES